MSLDIAPIGPPELNPAYDKAPRVSRVAADDRSAVSSGEIPAAPPAEVLDAVGVAAQRHGELLAQGRELRFAEDGGGVRVELLDGEGNVLRTLAPSEALDVATGGSVD